MGVEKFVMFYLMLKTLTKNFNKKYTEAEMLKYKKIFSFKHYPLRSYQVFS